MRLGLDLPPQIRVFGAFFIYSFCMGSFFRAFPTSSAPSTWPRGPWGWR